MPAEEPTVFVIDDQNVIRKSLSFLMSGAGFAVEAYSSAQAFLAAYDPERPGCIVLDLNMPGMSGMALLEYLGQRGDGRPVIVLTGHGDVPTAVHAMKAGAVDFVLKPYLPGDLIERVRQAVGLDAQWRQWRSDAAKVAERLRTLSPREREVFDQVVNGRSTKEIAASLGLSPKTVEIHRHGLLKKMKARSAVELTKMAAAVPKAPASTVRSNGPDVNGRSFGEPQKLEQIKRVS